MKRGYLQIAIALCFVAIGCDGNKKMPRTDAELSAGAGSSGSPEPRAKVTESDSASEALDETSKASKSSKSCRLTSFVFPLELGPSGKRQVVKKTLSFAYDSSGRVVEAVTGVEGTDDKERSSYRYDDKDRLVEVSVKKAASNQFQGLKAVYEYGSGGELKRIVGSGALATRSFGHDESGRILKQDTQFDGRVAATFTYSYDSKGAPSSVNVIGPDGKSMTGFTFGYDTQHNPFADKGLASVTGLLFGHPVGAYKHNIVRHETRNPQAPGQVQVRKMRYTYNPYGYPVTLTQMQGGTERKSHFEYQCD